MRRNSNLLYQNELVKGYTFCYVLIILIHYYFSVSNYPIQSRDLDNKIRSKFIHFAHCRSIRCPWSWTHYNEEPFLIPQSKFEMRWFIELKFYLHFSAFSQFWQNSSLGFSIENRCVETKKKWNYQLKWNENIDT